MQGLIETINNYLVKRYSKIYTNFKDNVRDHLKIPDNLMSWFEQNQNLNTFEKIVEFNELINSIKKDDVSFIGSGVDLKETHLWLIKVSSSQLIILGNNLQSNLEKEENRVTLYNLILQIFIQNIKELEEVYKKQTNENIVSTFKNLSKHLAKISEYDIQTALERLNVEIMDLYVEIHNILSKGLKESDKSELELKFIQNITEFRYLLGYLSTIMIQNALELKLIPDEVAKTLEGFDEWLNVF